jgi:hypothetical protein
MKIRVIIFTSIICWPLFAWPQEVYDGYETYYSAQNGLFKTTASFHFSGSRNTVVLWQGRRIDLAKAKAFPGEFTKNDDLGSDAKAYEHFPFACVEGQSSSASGSAVRHISVYLMEMRSSRQIAVYKLPSLFASCLGVRLDAFMRPLFDSAVYIYPPGADRPSGVRLDEYVIDKDKFAPTGRSVALDFIEPENVWKFRVQSVK